MLTWWPSLQLDTRFSDKLKTLSEEVGVLIINRFDWKVDPTFRNTYWHLFSTVVSFLYSDDTELCLNVANVALYRSSTLCFEFSGLNLPQTFFSWMKDYVHSVWNWAGCWWRPFAPITLSSRPRCHCFHSQAEAGSHEVTWLSKPTVLVSALHNKALCLVPRPRVLNRTHSCDVWHSLRCWVHVSAVWGHVMRGWNGLTAKWMTLACQGVCVFCWLYVAWLSKMDIHRVFAPCLSVVECFEMRDMAAELVKCLSDCLTVSETFPASKLEGGCVWQFLYLSDKCGHFRQQWESTSPSYVHSFSCTPEFIMRPPRRGRPITARL